MRRRLFVHQLIVGAFVGLLILGVPLPTQAQAQSFAISVEVDETTDGDMKIVESALAGATEGAEVSKSLRKVIMGVLGELSIEQRKRIDDNGALTLDDGTLVALLEGDTIEVARKDQPGAVLEFVIDCSPPPGSFTCKPHPTPRFICLVRVDGSTMCSDFPPKQLGRPKME